MKGWETPYLRHYSLSAEERHWGVERGQNCKGVPNSPKGLYWGQGLAARWARGPGTQGGHVKQRGSWAAGPCTVDWAGFRMRCSCGRAPPRRPDPRATAQAAPNVAHVRPKGDVQQLVSVTTSVPIDTVAPHLWMFFTQQVVICTLAAGQKQSRGQPPTLACLNAPPPAPKEHPSAVQRTTGHSQHTG